MFSKRMTKTPGLIIDIFGQLSAYALVLLMTVTALDVFMRYFLNQGSVAFQELEWHLFSAVFLLGSAYTLRCDQHVRVDIFFKSRFCSQRTRKLIDLLGAFFFLLPFCGVIVWSSGAFVFDAFHYAETSPDPGGLTHRWIVKSLIPLGASLLCVQGIITAIAAFRERNKV
jgi:TRAP-type mannitol/chloroaromatic compound transport system permease small subunit